MRSIQITKETVKDRFNWVADFVVRMTSKKINRERVNEYQVKKIGKKYQILFAGNDTGYGLMTSDNLYNWMARLPLNHFLMDAENIRTNIMMNPDFISTVLHY